MTPLPGSLPTNWIFTIIYDSRDEMGRLCASFEKMRSDLLENQRTMWRQMEERSRLNAAFSHDMRTPLTVLKGHADMLLSALPEDAVSREEVREEVSTMSHHIERLENYVEAMDPPAAAGGPGGPPWPHRPRACSWRDCVIRRICCGERSR